MHHFVTEMFTCVYISVTEWCIMGYGMMYCDVCATGLLDPWIHFSVEFDPKYKNRVP